MEGQSVVFSLLILFCLYSSVCPFFFPLPESGTGISNVRKAPRINIPWLGLGMYCNGCPPTSCEDDEAIIHGYCCGCSLAFDDLPVMCPKFLQCPLNGKGLCHDYEYMMRCCC